jgi:hypothetical protein
VLGNQGVRIHAGDGDRPAEHPAASRFSVGGDPPAQR